MIPVREKKSNCFSRLTIKFRVRCQLFFEKPTIKLAVRSQKHEKIGKTEKNIAVMSYIVVG